MPDDEFEQITEGLKGEGMSAEAATLMCVTQEALRVGHFYLTLVSLGTDTGHTIKPSHALELTQQWVAVVNEQEEDED